MLLAKHGFLWEFDWHFCVKLVKEKRYLMTQSWKCLKSDQAIVLDAHGINKGIGRMWMLVRLWLVQHCCHSPCVSTMNWMLKCGLNLVKYSAGQVLYSRRVCECLPACDTTCRLFCITGRKKWVIIQRCCGGIDVQRSGCLVVVIPAGRDASNRLLFTAHSACDCVRSLACTGPCICTARLPVDIRTRKLNEMTTSVAPCSCHRRMCWGGLVVMVRRTLFERLRFRS